MDAPAVIARKSGLLTTIDTFAKKQRTMARSKFRRLLTHRAFAREQGLSVQLLCERCQRPLKLTSVDHPLVAVGSSVNPKKDAFALTCACTTWTVGR
jgi:hypothetical protein